MFSLLSPWPHQEKCFYLTYPFIEPALLHEFKEPSFSNFQPKSLSPMTEF